MKENPSAFPPLSLAPPVYPSPCPLCFSLHPSSVLDHRSLFLAYKCKFASICLNLPLVHRHVFDLILISISHILSFALCLFPSLSTFLFSTFSFSFCLFTTFISYAAVASSCASLCNYLSVMSYHTHTHCFNGLVV